MNLIVLFRIYISLMPFAGVTGIPTSMHYYRRGVENGVVDTEFQGDSEGRVGLILDIYQIF